MTTGVNHKLTFSEDVFQKLIWNPLVAAGIAALDAQVPVLAVWPLSTIINGSINALSGYIFGQIRLIVDVTAITLLNDAHQSAYDEASEELTVIAHDQGVKSDAFIKARDNAASALAKFVQFNQ